ncbi:hypothetical protein BAE44_0007778 [Dichanthelium oligosanthes]|uniref:Uncharacterized protein n=1 Tax=Dichanthelium oligosanthes TaxID=888268 RepID=A0A1E5W1B6_9POAL|nr:hypothetical protein BAE44_0007778 [Dichanthelium oligosanthes]
MAGFLLLTGNSIVAIHRSQGDVAEPKSRSSSSPGSAAKYRARVGVWLTTTLLTAMFTSRVAALMPGAVATAVWCLVVDDKTSHITATSSLHPYSKTDILRLLVRPGCQICKCNRTNGIETSQPIFSVVSSKKSDRPATHHCQL